MKRYVYMSFALALALVTAFLVLRTQHTVAVLYATHDVAAGSQIAADDLEVRRIHDDGAPSGALAGSDAASGRWAALPLTAGEPVLDRAVTVHRSGSGLSHQFRIPKGYLAVAVPVQPAGAVGGMVQPGDHVDVWATPLAGHDASASPGPGTSTRLLGRDVIVLELRSDQGQSLQQQDASGSSVHGLNFGGGKLGSVVLAVPADDVQHYAAATTASSIYLALSVG